MIGPPTPAEVFGRHYHNKSPALLSQFYNHFLPAHRWTKAVLSVGPIDQPTLNALAEFHPDAVVHSLSDRKPEQSKRIVGLLRADFSGPDQFASEYAGAFGVVIVTDDTHPLPIRRTVKSYGIMVVERVAKEDSLREFGFRIEEVGGGKLAYYLNY